MIRTEVVPSLALCAAPPLAATEQPPALSFGENQ